MAAKLLELAAAIVAFAGCACTVNAARSMRRTVNFVSKAAASAEHELERFRREQQEMVENITQNMTIDGAFDMLEKDPRVTKEAIALFTKVLGGLGKPQLRAHGASGLVQNTPGYGGLDSAKTMLNQMLDESTKKLEFETTRCKAFFSQQCSLMETCRQDIATANAQAARFRGQVLDAQGEINVCEVNLPRLKNEYEDHNKQCAMQLADLDVNLRIVLDDIAVMTRVLEMTDCNAPATASLLLFECRHHKCQNKSFVSFGHGELRQQLAHIRSPALRQQVQRGLRDLAGESEKVKMASSVFLQDAHEQPMPLAAANVTNFTNPPLPQFEVPDDPCKGITYDDGMGKGKCSLASNPQCYKLQSKFLAIQGGIVDKKDDLLEQIQKLEESCADTKKTYEEEIEQFEVKLKSEQTKLAQGTDGENTAAEQGRMKNQEHSSLSTDMKETRDECSQKMRTFESEICGVKKIRGELYKMQGSSGFFQDCEVTEWEQEECSATCGGGTALLTRNVLARPMGGMSCPPLRAMQKCNEQPCPIDCQLSIWSGWSSCSADCGGGVIERIRQIEVEPRYDGTPCGETSESVSCNMQSCDANCELEDWTAWASCSKACGGGMNVRRRAVKSPARGDGTCPKVSDKERHETRPCNPFGCSNLTCLSKVDVVLALDGSSSLGEAGWNATKAFADQFLSAFEGNGSDAQVSVIVFSGPRTWSDYRTCVGTSQGQQAPNHMRDVCGINIVQHFTPLVSQTRGLVAATAWPKGTTLTSVAMKIAQAEVKLSRGDAPAIVLFVSDGLPLSPRMTEQASADIKKVARLMFAPVNQDDDTTQAMRTWASTPAEENLISIPSFAELSNRAAVDHIIADMCPKIQGIFENDLQVELKASMR